MKIFMDVFSGDELFSDTYKFKLLDDCLYEVYGKYVTRTDGDVVLDGANASAEEAMDDCDSSSTSGVDVVLNHRLVETGFGSKKDYTVYLKDYMKKVVRYLEGSGKQAEVDTFKTNINKVMKEILPRFKDLQFYTGETMDPEAMIIMLEYKEVDGKDIPVLYFFKHGLNEQKF
ncbi:translationally-controlled tumor protein homolog [Lepeophtheirus salmonis]|uniref:Translationally-controlled tumor protein homolog n=1 Tax=Lepeophtheirus salmonis TaxID=72036 RepID=C1BVC4_LEPSM|nr:translationally-controlled tumor protein homolog [Lepeophtheirus salmonis]ACO12977.1 Translationally-controlled tumor protein homolog [Lepeophtheirus salmonis]